MGSFPNWVHFGVFVLGGPRKGSELRGLQARGPFFCSPRRFRAVGLESRRVFLLPGSGDGQVGSLLGGSLNGSVGVSKGSLYGYSIRVVSSLNGTLRKRTMKGTHLRFISELRGIGLSG